MKITPYTIEDNEAALDLESQCFQGRSLVLKYRRPTFHARSGVYHKYRILCAKEDSKLIGITAWAEKFVSLHREVIRSAYVYDLRIHPNYRGKGLAKCLTKAMFDDMGQEVDCIYTLIAGENERALGLAQRILEMKLVIPFTYAVVPVYKLFKPKKNHSLTTATEIHKQYLLNNDQIEFIPEFDEKKMIGYVTSISLHIMKTAGCSIWTNENLLSEQVVSIPLSYRVQRILSIPLRPFVKLPYIPKPGDTIQSWFLFDLYAGSEKDFHNLLAAVNNLAFEQGRKFLYALLQDNNPLLTLIKKSGCRIFTFPYCFLAKGRNTPAKTDKIYIDVRDL